MSSSGAAEVASATPSPRQPTSIQGKDRVPADTDDAKKGWKELHMKAMRNKWQDVAAIYDKKKEVRSARITRGNTVLHLAVLSGDEANVMLLMKSLDKEDHETPWILGLENEMKETPLHLAAALGMERVCLAMAKLSPGLVMDARNNRRETPLFKAVRHGQKYAFFALQSVVESQIGPAPPSLSDKPRDVSVCKREGEDTILHNAIFGEHFDLALEIIKQYPELVTFITGKGESPLHVLAKKPSVFKSGIHFSTLDSILYYCTFVDPLEVEYPKYKEKIVTTDNLKNQQNVSFSPSFFKIKEESSTVAEEDPEGGGKPDQRNSGSQDKGRFPKNSDMFSSFFKLAMKGLLFIVGIGLWWRIQKIKKQKRQNTHARQIMEELVSLCKEWNFDEGRTFPMVDNAEVAKDDAKTPEDQVIERDAVIKKKIEFYQDKQLEDDPEPKIQPVRDAPILVAAKRGASEMVEKLLDEIPTTASDLDRDGKNFVLLAVEHRQSRIYELARKRKAMEHIAAVDKDGNSTLHLAARLGRRQPLGVPGAALRMQWEVKWFEYVAESVDPQFFQQYNNKDETARQIFIEEHRKLTEESHQWLTETSESCSVVAALIATVAFTTATNLPGGFNQESGFPLLEGQPAFKIFAISALVALCSSVTALVTFLSFVTSRYNVWDFDVELPLKLIVNLTSLLLSIAAMLVSFCASHFFVMEKQLKNATYVYPIYAAVCLPVSLFALTQLSLYVDLIKATFAKVPESAHDES